MDQQDRDNLTTIKTDVGWLRASFEKLEKNSVPRSEFEPVKRIVYGATALILTSFLVGLIVVVMP